MKRFFSSDQHFGHKAILKFEKRPFKTIEEMNSKLIKYHNERVKKEDEIYLLGDLLFRGKPKDYLEKMNGIKVHVLGNHDRNNKHKGRIEQIYMRLGGLRVQLVHDPKWAQVDFQLILCGHVHSNFKVRELHYIGKKSLVINVGLDVWNYRPVSWDELQGIYLRWKSGSTIESLNKWGTQRG